jgi:hypothetical protein
MGCLRPETKKKYLLVEGYHQQIPKLLAEVEGHLFTTPIK